MTSAWIPQCLFCSCHCQSSVSLLTFNSALTRLHWLILYSHASLATVWRQHRWILSRNKFIKWILWQKKHFNTELNLLNFPVKVFVGILHGGIYLYRSFTLVSNAIAKTKMIAWNFCRISSLLSKSGAVIYQKPLSQIWAQVQQPTAEVMATITKRTSRHR